MYKNILLRFGEISLKGQNRYYFVKKLINNIKNALKNIEFEIDRTYGRIFIKIEDADNMEKVLTILKLIPGIVSVSPVAVCSLDFENLKKISLNVFKDAAEKYPTTFKVETRRANKGFPLKSPEISRKLGAYILKKINNSNKGETEKLSVDVHNPEHVVNIEVRKKHIYVFSKTVQGPGGLPVGSSGRGMLMLSGGIDSPVAGWLAMKRGMEVEALYFHTPPYTGDRVREKVIDLAKILSRYCLSFKLNISHFTDIQMAIQKTSPSKYNITIMRRMMFRLAEKIAREKNSLALITGESIGQVASQTLESMHVINAVTNMPVIRPLVTMDKTEITSIAQMIGTYKTSIQPHEDCCTIFVPEHPVTRPTLEDSINAEKNLEVKKLIEENFKKTETIVIKDGEVTSKQNEWETN